MTANLEYQRLLQIMFPDLSRETLQRVLSLVNVASYERHTHLCVQGEVADKFYILLKGKVGVYYELEAHNEMYQIDSFRQGCFGEVALLLGRPRTAYIIAKERVTVLEISHEDFARLNSELPEFTFSVTKMVLARMVEQDDNKIVRLRDKVREQPADTPAPGWTTLAERASSTLFSVREKEWRVKPIWGLPDVIHEEFKSDVFMIMPFREPYNSIYEHFVKDIALNLNLRIKRGDDPFVANSSVMNDIWSMMNSTKVVVAECTEANANVYYELGIVHTLGKPTIILTQSEKVPFDIAGIRYIRYEENAAGLRKLREELSEALRKILGRDGRD